MFLLKFKGKIFSVSRSKKAFINSGIALKKASQNYAK
jgi:hypothetical protein